MSLLNPYISFPVVGGGGGVPVVEEVTQVETGADAATITIASHAGTSDNDILLLILQLNSGTDASPSISGFTSKITNTAGVVQTHVFWKRASSESGNYVANWTGNLGGGINLIRISGAEETGDPFDQVGTVEDSYGDSPNPSGITSTEDNTLVLAYSTNDTNYNLDGNETATGTGWSLSATPDNLGSTSGIGCILAEKDLVSTGSSSPDPTLGAFANGGESFHAQVFNIKSN